MTTILQRLMFFNSSSVDILLTKNEYYNCFFKNRKGLEVQEFDCISNIPYIPISVLQMMKYNDILSNRVDINIIDDDISQSIYDFFKNILTETLTNDLIIFQSYCTKKTTNLLELKENKLNEIINELIEKENKLNKLKNKLEKLNYKFILNIISIIIGLIAYKFILE